ncbi:MAG: hypothetical protein ACK401_03575 [Archaeoglobaceae archaeon]
MISEILTAFFYSVLSISLLLCYRAGKILNLSFASFLTLGAYLSAFNALLSIFAGALAGYFLHLATRNLGVAKSTIFSLGFAIAVEEVLRISFRMQYLLIPLQRVEIFGETILEFHLISGLISIAFLFSLFGFLFSKSSAVLRIVEEDYEISELYGVRTEKIRAIVLIVTSSIICLLGSFQHSGIMYPTMGWHFLIFAVIIATIANLTPKPYFACVLSALVVSWLTSLF